jgi:hypothetical protein
MKRGDFLKELGNSLFETVKSVYEPFIQEDIEKVGEAADRALGITWMPLMNDDEFSSDLDIKFIARKPIIISRNGTNMQAFDGVCPVCSNIIILSTLYSSGKCLNCQKEFNFKTMTGDLQLDLLPTKIKDYIYFVGLHRFKK